MAPDLSPRSRSAACHFCDRITLVAMNMHIRSATALNQQPARVAGAHQRVEIAYAVHRTSRNQSASVAASRGSRTERRRALSAAGGKRPNEPTAGSPSGAITSGAIAPGAIAQAQSPQAQSPEVQSPSPTISDQKLSAAAAAIGQVATIRHSYESRIAEAPPSDQERLTGEANDALEKAVTDQGLSVDEYNTIIKTAQNNPAIRQKLAQRIPHSGQ